MRFLAHSVRSVYSVLLSDAQKTISAHDDAQKFVTEPDSTDGFYHSLFTSLLSQAATLAQVVPRSANVQASRNEAKREQGGERPKDSPTPANPFKRQKPAKPAQKSAAQKVPLIKWSTPEFKKYCEEHNKDPSVLSAEGCAFCASKEHRTMGCTVSAPKLGETLRANGASIPVNVLAKRCDLLRLRDKFVAERAAEQRRV